MDLYGPALPPGYVKPDDDESDNDSNVSEKQSKRSPKIIGPQFPDFLQRKLCDETTENSGDSETRNSIGPTLPSSFQNSSYNDEEDHESYGPLPNQSSGESDLYDQRAAIEKRAENMRNKLDNKYTPLTESLQREEWMVVPDTSSKNQLAAISQCLAPQKPALKERHHHRHSEKDKKTTEELKKYNKSKRSESLLDMHKKSLKKKSKEKNKPNERKAFDRDEIGIKQFSKQQVNTIVDKAKYLNSRFGSGSQQYL
ncbi:GPALPP motifs-containing protein 1-like [Argiope bruennichi]|uniref:GPALPP motifs-containing protein 1 n=1 Tax=Argiope bruennichi TaxID=94029 RepID=A0A8T0FQ92_ARGBR|nr:GPALPP motifs-containing protein 1-like [Argiope bruennichi]KAF8793357.1 GPALPP motifs-containing protein 1 [Argiope bruennichi]